MVLYQIFTLSPILAVMCSVETALGANLDCRDGSSFEEHWCNSIEREVVELTQWYNWGFFREPLDESCYSENLKEFVDCNQVPEVSGAEIAAS